MRFQKTTARPHHRIYGYKAHIGRIVDFFTLFYFRGCGIVRRGCGIQSGSGVRSGSENGHSLILGFLFSLLLRYYDTPTSHKGGSV
jgi:hypothetical protein